MASPSRARRRLVALALLVLLVVSATQILVSQADVSHASAQVATGRLRLASKTAWVQTGGLFELTVDLDGTSERTGLDLAVRIHNPVRFRSGYQASIDGNLPRAAATPELVVPISDLVPDGNGDLPVRFRLGGPIGDEPGVRALPALGRGVYPVAVSLRQRGSGRTIDRFVTHLVRTTDEEQERLRITWVQSFGTTPVLQPDGTRRLGERATQQLVSAAAALGATDLPLTLQVRGAGVDGVDADAREAIVPDLRGVVDRGQLVSGGYTSVDAAALVEAGLDDELVVQREQGDLVLRRLLGDVGDPRVWVADHPLPAGTVSRLRELGVTQLVVPEEGLRALPTRLTGGTTLARPFSLAGRDGTSLPAAVADAGVRAHFDVDDPVLGAHRLLADLAVIELDAPGTPRGIVVRPPERWVPDPAFLGAVSRGLTGSPVLQASTLDQLLTAVPPLQDGRRAVVRETTTTAATGVATRQLVGARSSVVASAGLAGGDSDIAVTLRRMVLLGESATLGPATRRAHLDGAVALAGGLSGRVRVSASEDFRLTAREGRIPISVVNDNPFAVLVDLEVSAERLKFTGSTEGDGTRQTFQDLEVPPGARRTLLVQVEARTSGASALRTVLRSADGGLVLSRGRFTITSTAVSGVGIVLSVGALAFLVVWWVRNWRRSRIDTADDTGHEGAPAG